MGVENAKFMFPAVMGFLAGVTSQSNRAKNYGRNKEADVLIFSASASLMFNFALLVLT